MCMSMCAYVSLSQFLSLYVYVRVCVHRLQAIAAQFSDDDTLFKYHFVQGWTKMMDADRFDGPVKNVCDSKPADY